MDEKLARRGGLAFPTTTARENRHLPSELDDFATVLAQEDWDAVSAVSLDRAYRLGRDARAQSWAMAEEYD